MKRMQKIIIVAIACILTVGMVSVQEPSTVQASPKAAAVRKITLSKKKLTVEAGSSKKLTVKKLPKKTKVTWKTSNAKVATVKNGTVKGISAGTAVITAKAGAKKATCKVTVVLGKEASKALKAYKSMLSKETMRWGTDNDHTAVPTKNCKFAVAYIDNDFIPELIVYNSLDVAHVSGHGVVYTYKNGKVRVVQNIQLDEKFSYYERKGVFVTDYVMGGITYHYYKMKNGKATRVLRMGEDSHGMFYYDEVREQEISKKEFNNALKKLVGSSKKKNLILRENTADARKKYLK